MFLLTDDMKKSLRKSQDVLKNARKYLPTDPNYEEYIMAQMINLFKKLEIDLQVFSACCGISAQEFCDITLELKSKNCHSFSSGDYRIWLIKILGRAFQHQRHTDFNRKSDFLVTVIDELLFFDSTVNVMKE